MNKIKLAFQVLLLLLSLQVKALVVLQYHHISEATPKITSLSPDLFRQHLDYLSDNDFNVISINKAIALLKGEQPLPEKLVIITFDDGYRSIYETAFPMLKEKKFPFTVFVSTQPINTNLKQFLSWAELKEMSLNQATIANHTVNHPSLIESLIGESEAQWEIRVTSEVMSAQKHIDQNIGTEAKVFAYPYGEFNFRLKNILNELGYVSFAQHSGAVSIDVDLQAIPRFPFAGIYGNIDDFVTKVNSLPLPLETVELLDQNDQLLIDHIISTDVGIPKLKLTLQKEYEHLDIQCYLSGFGKINKTKVRRSSHFQAFDQLPMSRSRYNCTALSRNKLNVYWFSQPWIKVKK